MTIAPETIDRMVEVIRSAAAAEWCGKIPSYITEARAIAALLPAPVDPDLVEAREVAGDAMASPSGIHCYATGSIVAVRTGKDDSHPMVVAALRALKRGRELQGQGK